MARPRLIVELSDEQMARLRKNLAFGEQGELFRKIVDDIMDFYERYSKVGIAMYMSNKLSLLEVLQMKEVESGLKKPKAKSPRAAS